MNMSIDPLSGGLQAVGMLGGFLSGQGAANKSKQLMGLQRGFLRRELGQYDQLQPQYMQALQQYGQSIGAVPGGPQGYGDSGQHYRGGTIGAHAGVQPGQTASYANPFQPGADNGFLMGPYSQQAYKLRMAAAEEALNDQTRNQDQSLMFNLGQRGIATGTQAAALARSHEDALRGYAQYVRGLAINAGPAEQQQQAQYLNLLQGGMGAGQSAAAGIGQQAGIYGQQAAQGFGAAGQIAGNFVQNQQMAHYLQALYGQQRPPLPGAGGAGYEPTDEAAQSYLYGKKAFVGPPSPYQSWG